MKRIMARRPSPAMVVALIALVASLGGVGYAASKINGKTIKNSSIAGKKLKTGSVKSKQLKDGGVAAKDLAAGVIPTIPPITPEARTFRDGSAINIGDGVSNFATVGTLSPLPAGDYYLSGKAEVQPNPLGGTDTAQVICALFVNGGEVDRSRLQIGENAADASTLRGTIPVETTVAVPENGVVTLGCAKGGANISIEAAQRSVSAVAVALP